MIRLRRLFILTRRGGVALAILAALAASGCTPAQLVKGAAGAALGGGGPRASANVLAGQNNAQGLGQTQISTQKLERAEARTIEQSAGETGVRAEVVQSVTVHNEAPPWVWLIAILAVGFGAAAIMDEISDRMRRRKKEGAANADQ